MLPFCLPTAHAEELKLVTIFEGQTVEVPLPKGWTFKDQRDPATGVQTLAMSDTKREVELQFSFFPDPEGSLATRKGLEEQARTVFAFYLDQSVEKEMKLTPFETADGLGVFTSFTDSKLDPKKIPEGEHLISTTGLRSWKGAYLLFTLLTDSRDSSAYKTALEIVRSGLKLKVPAAL